MHSSRKRTWTAPFLALILLAAVSCTSADTGAADSGTADISGTDSAAVTETAAETEMETETEAETAAEAATEANIHADEQGDITVTPVPIRRTDDWVDWNADYNNPKVALDEIVEGLVSQNVYVGRDGWLFYYDSIQDFTGENLYSAAMLKRIAKQMQERADW